MVLDLTNRGEYKPEDKDQALIATPYGNGQVIRTRKDRSNGNVTMREIELLDWKTTTNFKKGPNRPNLLYSPQQFPSILPKVGDDVMTLFGRGRILEIRSDDMCIVRIKSWRLAGRSNVTCYLPASNLQVLLPKKIYEMDVFDKVETAQNLKQEANQIFAKKEYQQALNLYAKAVDAVRWVQHSKTSSNEVRADLLVIMITCSNNAGTCCTQLHKWEEANKFGENALVLTDALYAKRGNSKIKTVLNREGISDSQLFGTWKAKSCLIIARAQAERHNNQEATAILKKGWEAVTEFKKDSDSHLKMLSSQEKQIRKLLMACKDRLRAEREKEKKRAQKMFGGGSGKAVVADKDDHNGADKMEAQSTARQTPSPTNKSPPSPAIKSQSAVSKGETKSRDMSTSTSTTDGSDQENSKQARHVSFEDGSRPGEVDDNDGPSFWEEHKEAVLILGGVALGSMLVQVLLRRKR